MLKIAHFSNNFQQIRCATFTPPVKIEDTINDALEKELYKPKSHPGRVNLKNIMIPEHIVDAIKTCVDGIFILIKMIFFFI